MDFSIFAPNWGKYLDFLLLVGLFSFLPSRIPGWMAFHFKYLGILTAKCPKNGRGRQQAAAVGLYSSTMEPFHHCDEMEFEDIELFKSGGWQ